MTPYWPFPAYADWSSPMQVLTFRTRSPGIGAGHPLIIGDSIANHLPYNSACGQWIVNCGIEGARAHDFLVYVEQIMSTVQPSDVIIAVGTNDLAQPEGSMGAQSNYWYWQQDYFYLALCVKQAGISPVLMTILPTEASLTSGPLASHNNPTKLAQYNDYIKACGTTLQLPPVQDVATALAGPDGHLPAGSTYDGLHPLGALNAPLWAQYVAALRASRAARGITADDTLAMIP